MNDAEKRVATKWIIRTSFQDFTIDELLTFIGLHIIAKGYKS